MCEPSNLDRLRELSKELEGQEPPAESQINVPSRLNKNDQSDSYFMQALRSILRQMHLIGNS
jgi:hypothetical protein